MSQQKSKLYTELYIAAKIDHDKRKAELEDIASAQDKEQIDKLTKEQEYYRGLMDQYFNEHAKIIKSIKQK